METGIDTPAVRAARQAGLDVTVVRTRPPSNAQESAGLQGIALDELLRTIVVRRGAGDYVFVLVPGGRQIDWPKLRAHLGVNRLSLPDEAEAREATGYERGAITPLGALGGPTGRPWPVVADASVRGLEKVAIGGGARGVNLHLPASALLAHLGPAVADVTRPLGDPPR
jgi:Cys-tRNA(Pro)/Cys-tRNA(Cys) deacylase